jgi:Holliday junction resolvasome RuvABC ATP-dependent DNA helicase subunit
MANQLQGLLTSRAVSVAKGLSHPEVLRSHVLVAIAETVLDEHLRYERSKPLREALPARGASIKVPTIADEAAALIAQCSDARAALEILDGATPPGASEGSFAAATEGEPDTTEPTADVEEKAHSAADLLAELDALVGLEGVKKQLRKVISVVEANKIRADAGAKAVPQSLHLVFTGNPGTGKTTVARIVAKMYGATGALKGQKFREATRSDLVAPYVGQTSQQTDRVLQSVRPGVLFIDEAYSLKPSHHGDFAEEAVAAMVKGMEDYRAEIAIIVAGYKDEMGEFVQSNPGLRSRFQTFIQFDDYGEADLLEIYRRFAEDANIRLALGVNERVTAAITSAAGQPGFGNARFVRALWEESYANMAVRAASDGQTTSSELEEILPADVPEGVGSPLGLKRKIGF